jgi:threonylcarbamoyladenosine tRNA methylthiotransferase MtaB
VLGTNEKFDIAAYIKNHKRNSGPEVHSCELSSADSFFPSSSFGDRTRSFLKIQDGCDYGCSYCTIPFARGRSRNPNISSIISEAKEIAHRGVKEIVLTGVNIGDFGKSTGDTFASLLRELVKVEGIERYRISSIEPNLLTDEIIDLAEESPRILPHFHIPLQSGCNKILGLMRRRYRREVFAERINAVISRIPDAGIGADVIVGFPGENETDFMETYSFLESLPLSYLHVFPFSERPGTVAAGLTGKLSANEKESRCHTLLDLSRKKNLDFYRENIGRETNVLFEKNRVDGFITGFSPNYIKIQHPWQTKLAGNIRKVVFKDIAPGGRMNVELKN